jgi:hypothetical protein
MEGIERDGTLQLANEEPCQELNDVLPLDNL